MKSTIINRQWNECFLELSSLARDKITKLSFAIETFGKELTMGNNLCFDIDCIEFQTVENPEIARGWIPADNRIIFSTSGYRPDSEKTAISSVKEHNGKFQLIDNKTKDIAYEGNIQSVKKRIGSFDVINFTDFAKEGEYYIKIGDITTAPFYINKNLWDDSSWLVLNFIFRERSSYPIPEKHGACHTEMHAEYNGKLYPINCGWHAAADMSQQTLLTGEIAYSLIETALRAKEKNNTDLYNRLMEEGMWGIDYVLRSRVGNGYRVQGWGTNLWTDRYINTIDDAGRRQAHIHNGAYENFMLTGIEAYAFMAIEKDQMLKDFLVKAAKEDFEFASKRFDEFGYNERIPDHSHAYMASQSQYMANIYWAVSMLYKLTNDPYYANRAAETIKYTLQCQRTENH